MASASGGKKSVGTGRGEEEFDKKEAGRAAGGYRVAYTAGRHRRRERGMLTGNVVNNDGDCRVSDVTRYERAEAFLSRCVPQLQSDSSILEIHGFT